MSDSQPSEFLYFGPTLFFMIMAAICILCNRLCSSEACEKREPEGPRQPLLGKG